MLQTVILAAGKGSRMQSDIPKPLIEVDGEPMLTKVLRTLADSQCATLPVIVVGSWTTLIQEHYGDAYIYAIQTDISGTATAAKAALPHLDTSVGAPPVLILYADHPFLQPASIQNIYTTYQATTPKLALCTVTVPDFDGWRQPFASFGRIVRSESGAVERIVEVKNATPEELALTEVNPALYCVDAAWLAEALPRIKQNELTGEYYLTDLVELAVASGEAIATIALAPEEALGLNSIADIENATKAR